MLTATLILLLCDTHQAQTGLLNTYSSWHEVLGGMEDGGVERTESYIFVAKKTVKIKDIFYEDKEIDLKRGDTLQIIQHTFKPYQHAQNTNTTKAEQPGVKNRFRVTKKNNLYYANVVFPYQWNKKIEFVHKKKICWAETKNEFDKGKQEAAP